jgi:hypothetical protein
MTTTTAAAAAVDQWLQLLMLARRIEQCLKGIAAEQRLRCR